MQEVMGANRANKSLDTTQPSKRFQQQKWVKTNKKTHGRNKTEMLPATLEIMMMESNQQTCNFG